MAELAAGGPSGCASMPARSLSASTQFERSKWSLRTSQRPSSGRSSTILLTLCSSCSDTLVTVTVSSFLRLAQQADGWLQGAKVDRLGGLSKLQASRADPAERAP